MRHVYFSMVSLSLIVITNRFSNILGDSVTLRLLGKVTQVVAILKRMKSLSWRMRLTLTSHLRRSCFFFSSALGCDMHHHLVLVRFKNFAPMTTKDQAMVVLRSHSCLCAHFQLFLSLWICFVSLSRSHSAFSGFHLGGNNFAPMARRWWISGHFCPALLCDGTMFLDSFRDHTFIETVTVRHVYFSMVSLFLPVNRSSNILKDLETLRLLAKVWPLSSAIGGVLHHHFQHLRTHGCRSFQIDQISS